MKINNKSNILRQNVLQKEVEKFEHKISKQELKDKDHFVWVVKKNELTQDIIKTSDLYPTLRGSVGELGLKDVISGCDCKTDCGCRGHCDCKGDCGCKRDCGSLCGSKHALRRL